MTVSSVTQLQGLLYACGFGFLLGVWYDVFALTACVRRPSRLGRFIADAVFCLASAVLFFLFALTVTGGNYRWYLFCGSAVGFLMWRATFGRLLSAVLLRLLRPLRRMKKYLSKAKEQMFVKIAKFAKKIGAKTHIFFKKRLHLKGYIVYNKSSNREQTERDESHADGTPQNAPSTR